MNEHARDDRAAEVIELRPLSGGFTNPQPPQTEPVELVDADGDGEPDTTHAQPGTEVEPRRAAPLYDPQVLDAELVTEEEYRAARHRARVQRWQASRVVPAPLKSRDHAKVAAGRAVVSPWTFTKATGRGVATAWRGWRGWVKVADFYDAAQEQTKLADKWEDIHQHKKRRRALTIGGLLGATLAVFLVFAIFGGWWGAGLLVVLAAVLALLGRAKEGSPGRKSALGARSFAWTMDPELINVAFRDAKIIHKDEKLHMVQRPAQEGDGWAFIVDVPATRKAADAIKNREALASALAVDEVQLIVERVRGKGGHAGRLNIWVGNDDPYDQAPVTFPLVTAERWSAWQPVPFGRDARGRRIDVQLVWTSILVGAKPRQGKALALDTPVPTPTGWTTMGDLKDGDQVFGRDGRPCTVVKAHDVLHGRQCYEVEFSDGTVIVADAEHLWYTETRARRLAALQPDPLRTSPLARDQRRLEVVTTADIAASLHIGSERRSNHAVPVAAPLDLPDRDLPVDPYILGYWLGDGTSVVSVISCGDDDLPHLLSEIERAGYYHRAREDRTCWGVRFSTSPIRNGGAARPSAQAALRKLGVLGDKHIPQEYLRASESQRRALLAGLLDSDGYIGRDGVVEFSVCDKQLADATAELVLSLGFKVNRRATRRVRGRTEDSSTVYRVRFSPDVQVFRLPRKAERLKVQGRRNGSGKRRYVVDVRPVNSVPVRCITVDTADSLYLVSRSFIPTHNTFSARLPAAGFVLDPHTRIYCWDGKGGRDWRAVERVSHRWGLGASDEECIRLRDSLAELVAETKARYTRMGNLSDAQVPEGKLTPEITNDPAFDMPLVAVIIDELQNYTDCGVEGWKEKGKKATVGDNIGALLTWLAKTGPAMGVVLILATQRPDASTLPTGLRAVLGTRFALYVTDWRDSNIVLGEQMNTRGYDASTLLPKHKGVGILRPDGETAAADLGCPTVITYLMSLAEWAAVCERGRALRIEAGTLTGHAAGEAEEINVEALAVAEHETARLHLVTGELEEDAEPVGELAEVLVLLAEVIEDHESGLVPTGELADRIDWDAKQLGEALRRAGVQPPNPPRQRIYGSQNPVSVCSLEAVRAAIEGRS